MGITRKASSSCVIYLPLYGHYKESVLKLGNIYTIACSLQGCRLKVAEYIYHSMDLTRKAPKSWGIYVPSRADEEEHPTSLYSCHGVFIDRFIFGSNFPGVRLPWECHDKSQETN